MDATQKLDHAIKRVRRDSANSGIRPFPTIDNDGVHLRFQRPLMQLWDNGGIILQIAIDHDHPFPTRFFQPGPDSQMLAMIARQPYAAHARIAL